MRSAEIILDYQSIQKPFRLVERTHDLSGTDYRTICRLSLEDAELLADSGVSYLYKKPDLEKFFATIEKMEAEKAVADAKANLEKAEEKVRGFVV